MAAAQTFTWFYSEDEAQARRCHLLINRAAGYTDEQISEGTQMTGILGPGERPDQPGFGVAVGAGPDGIAVQDVGAMLVQDVNNRLQDVATPEECAEVQSRLTPEELTEVRSYLQAAAPRGDSWYYIPMREE
ncbi:MAG TPA: hypothetical protein VFQ61_06335 [Polyangiaceae bacterium]|nr:hypothetical protein [Polyangiaceae bacterium]